VELDGIDRLTEAQAHELVALYQKEWWTKGRELEDVRRMLEQTDIVVAFARGLTDGVYKALMDALLEHPRLKRVRHLELYCLPELIPFYRRWGFTDELRFLRRTQ
jgi:hypothetical protein